MNDFQNFLVSQLKLTNRVKCDFDCYLLAKRKYLIFLQKFITKEKINELLREIGEKCNNNLFSKWKSIIIVANTKDIFKKTELLYFDGVSTYVVFCLVDSLNHQLYVDDRWVFPEILNYKKYTKQIKKLWLEYNV